jgi:hypothetical protein
MVFNSSMLMAGATANASTYSIPYSARFVSGNSAYLTRTPGVAGNKQTFTISTWFKFGTLPSTAERRVLFSANSTNPYFRIEFDDSTVTGALMVYQYNGAAYDFQLLTTQVFRDPGAWYHVVVAFDTTQGTAANRIKVYINGAQITAFANADYPSASLNTYWNATNGMRIGRGFGTDRFDGYLANATGVDGSQLTPSSFGQTTTSGVWVPKAYAGTYGTNGFLMAFASSGALGTDTSGNGNTFTSSGLTAADQMADTPTLNYCTLNPLIASAANITNGNLVSGTTAVQGTFNALLFNSYWEVLAGGSAVTAGVISGTGTTTTTTVTASKRFGFRLSSAGALDYINITDAGAWTSITTGLSGQQFPYGVTQAATWNFGQSTFTGSVPATYAALNSTNLPAPAIKDGSAHFQTALHTGTGSAITINQSGNSTFTSDFVWTKGRSGATNHVLSNIISGTGKYLSSNATTAETTDAQALTAFGAGSISYGTLAAANTNAATYVDWMWKGGGAGVANSVGSITSTVSTNITAGIAVVTWTGTGVAGTIGHGLGVAPQLIIVKRRSSTGDWQVYHTSTGIGNYLLLDTTAASAADTLNVRWNNAAPTSTVFSVGTNADVNFLTGTFVAYCFAPIVGFSQFGSYTGNASADGAFVYTGFKPALVLIKSSSAVDDWRIYDSLRPGYNVQGGVLLADTTGVETTAAEVDLLSNGFKCRITTTPNAANTMIYATFSSNPFGGSGAAPATAR